MLTTQTSFRHPTITQAISKSLFSASNKTDKSAMLALWNQRMKRSRREPREVSQKVLGQSVANPALHGVNYIVLRSALDQISITNIRVEFGHFNACSIVRCMTMLVLWWRDSWKGVKGFFGSKKRSRREALNGAGLSASSSPPPAAPQSLIQSE